MLMFMALFKEGNMVENFTNPSGKKIDGIINFTELKLPNMTVSQFVDTFKSQNNLAKEECFFKFLNSGQINLEKSINAFVPTQSAKTKIHQIIDNLPPSKYQTFASFFNSFELFEDFRECYGKEYFSYAVNQHLEGVDEIIINQAFTNLIPDAVSMLSYSQFLSNLTPLNNSNFYSVLNYATQIDSQCNLNSDILPSQLTHNAQSY